MVRRPKVYLLSAFAATTMSVFACNLPAAAPPATEPPVSTAMPTDANSLNPTDAISPIPTDANPPIPTEQAIESDLPFVTLEGGSGYIFSSQLVSTDDRDIWWNAVQLVPGSVDRMVSLGIISTPAEVQEITFPGQTETTLVPAVGEGFGIEISRGNELTYAVIRVLQIDGERAITFDWVYPFGGIVTAGP
jgi:hypothetical protein